MLDVYLTASIGQLAERARHLVASISAQLAQKQQLSPEFHPLAQTCRSQANALISDLNSLLHDPRYRQPGLQNIRLRAYKRMVAELDFLECVGVAALTRVNDEDRKMTRLVSDIAVEIHYPLIPPVVSCQSQSYFQAFPDLTLLSIPLKEAHFLLHLPDLYHELGHFILNEQNNPATEPFTSALDAAIMAARGRIAVMLSQPSRGPQGIVPRLQAWDANWVGAWGIELFCDLFGTSAVGPAYGWSHLHLCAKRGTNPFAVDNFPSSSHPPDEARMIVILEALTQLGYGHDAAAIEEKWRELLAHGNYATNADFDVCFPTSLLRDIAESAVKGFRALNCQEATPNAEGRVCQLLNLAWDKFWAEPDYFSAWEKRQRVEVAVS